MILHKLSSAVLFQVIIINLVVSQDSITTDELKKTFAIKANVDGYFRHSSTGFASPTFLILEHMKPSLGSFNVELTYDHRNKFGFMLNLAAGPRAKQFYSLDNNNILNHIKQAYFYYNLNDKLKVIVGNSTAFIGYEYDEPHLNLFYSNSYINSATPATFNGMNLEIMIDENWTYNIGVYSEPDYKIDNIPGVHIGNILSWKKDNFSNSLGFMIGKIDYYRVGYIEYLMDYAINDKNSLALELLTARSSSIESNNISGMNIYFSHAPKDYLSLNLRGEYYVDNNYYFLADRVNGKGICFGAKVKLFKYFYIFPEIRYDKTNRSVFTHYTKGFINNDFSGLIGISIAY
ncbi:MAG: outer membrane beta-barrel protein [Saprospiraceae bacterium]|nr:outer membrane beta-barrel protein [Saprospiraceae bacterium]